MTLTGRIWFFGDDDINTDMIFPGKYCYSLLTDEEMAQFAMEDYNTRFVKKVQSGDIILAGRNFGSGSSREQAVKCLKAAGIAAIIAKSFSRIFYRNAINEALPAIECPEAVEFVRQQISITDSQLSEFFATVDLNTGIIVIIDKKFSFPPLNPQAMKIFEVGGLVEYTKYLLHDKKFIL